MGNVTQLYVCGFYQLIGICIFLLLGLLLQRLSLVLAIYLTTAIAIFYNIILHLVHLYCVILE